MEQSIIQIISHYFFINMSIIMLRPSVLMIWNEFTKFHQRISRISMKFEIEFLEFHRNSLSNFSKFQMNNDRNNDRSLPLTNQNNVYHDLEWKSIGSQTLFKIFTIKTLEIHEILRNSLSKFTNMPVNTLFSHFSLILS